MFPSLWTEQGVVHTRENGKVVMRTDVSASRIIVKTDLNIPSRDIIKCKIPRRDESDERIDERNICESNICETFPHAGVMIDPISGVPNHGGSSIGSKGGNKSDHEIESLFAAVGANAQESWEYEVHQITGPIYYWEAEVLSSVNSDNDTSSVGVGLIPAYDTSDPFTNFMNIPDSIAYRSSGLRVESGQTTPFTGHAGAGYGTHDVVGCGWEVGGGGRVFFTCNGRVIGKPSKGYGSLGQSYSPALELVGAGTTVRTNLGNDRFQLDCSNLFIANHVMVEYRDNTGSLVDTSEGPGHGVWTGIVKNMGSGRQPGRSVSTSGVISSGGGAGGEVVGRSMSETSPRGSPSLSGHSATKQRPLVQPLQRPGPSRPVSSAWGGGGGGGGGATSTRHRHGHVSDMETSGSSTSQYRMDTWRGGYPLRYDRDEDLVVIASALQVRDEEPSPDGGGDGSQWNIQDATNAREALLLLQGILESVTKTYEDVDTTIVKAPQEGKSGGRERECMFAAYDAENAGEILASVTANLGRLQKKMLRAINGTPEVKERNVWLRHN